MPIKDSMCVCVCARIGTKSVMLDWTVNWVTSLEPAWPEGWRVLSEVEPASSLIRVISQALCSGGSLVSIPDMSGEALFLDVDPTLIKHSMAFTDDSRLLTEGTKMRFARPRELQIKFEIRKSPQPSLNSLRTQWWGHVRLDFPHSVFSDDTRLWYAF